MSYIYDLWKRKLLELELNVMERYSDERLKKIVEETEHSMGMVGKVAEHSRLVAEGFGKAACEAAPGIGVSHYNPPTEG